MFYKPINNTKDNTKAKLLFWHIVSYTVMIF